MFIRQAGAGQTNTLIEWSGRDYINYTSDAAGAVYTRFTVDVSAGVSNIDTRSFDYTQNIQCDDTDYITDEAGNVYFLVVNFTTLTTSRPARS